MNTADRNAAIMRLWDEKLTAAQIATELGLSSRSIVVGVVSRAREKEDPRAAYRPKREKTGKRTRTHRSTIARIATPRLPITERLAVQQTEPVPSIAEGIRYIDAGMRQCKYFLGNQAGYEGKVCGCRVVPGESWCPVHCRVVFRAQRIEAAA